MLFEHAFLKERESMLKGIYQPRHAKATALFQCISNHFEEFESVYPEKYQERYGFYRSLVWHPGSHTMDVAAAFLLAGRVEHQRGYPCPSMRYW